MFSQTQWNTKVYTTGTYTNGDILDVYTLDEDLINISGYLLKILYVEDLNIGGGEYEIRLFNGNNRASIICGLYGCFNSFHGSGFNELSDEAFFTNNELDIWIQSNLSGKLTLAITAPFPDEDEETINNLQSQIDALVEQLTGCVDCQGDLNESQHTSVTDIVLLVEHILGSENGECYTN